MLRMSTMVLATLAVLAGCSDTTVNGSPAADGGASNDAGAYPDGASADAGVPEDRSVTGTWEKVEVKDADGNPITTMASVAVVSANEVYVVEGTSNLGTGFYRFDGATWTSVRYSDFAPTIRLLPSGELVAFGTSLMQKSASGNTWKVLPSPESSLMWDGSGDTAASLLVSTGTGVTQRTGNSWKPPQGMTATLPGKLLRTKDGKTFFTASNSSKSEFFRFDGSKWENLKTMLPAAHQAGGTRGIFGATSDDLWLIGSARTLLHFDGTGFTTVAGPGDEWGCDLTGGFATSKKNAWLYGANGCIFHWDGTAWSKTETGMKEPIFEIGGSDPENVWAVPANKVYVLRLRPSK